MEKAKGFFDFAKSALAVLAALFPLLVWGYTSLEAKAQEYIREIIAPELQGLSVQIEQQNQAIERLLRATTAESSQSEEEARINRRILCYQEALATDTNADACNEIQ